MHGVVVVPASAPDKAVFLEYLHYLQEHGVAVLDVVALGGAFVVPTPVAGFPHADVDGKGEAVRTEPLCAGHDAPVESAGAFQVGFPFGMTVELVGDLLQLLVHVVHRGYEKFLPAKFWTPSNCPCVLADFGGGVAVHLSEKGLAAYAARVAERQNGVGVVPESHVLDVAAFEFLLPRAFPVVVVEHLGAVGKDNAVAVETLQRLRIGVEQGLYKQWHFFLLFRLRSDNAVLDRNVCGSV